LEREEGKRGGKLGRLRKMEVEGGREENNAWRARKGRREESWREVKEDEGRGRQGRNEFVSERGRNYRWHRIWVRNLTPLYCIYIFF
jgi:hypothetical protein